MIGAAWFVVALTIYLLGMNYSSVGDTVPNELLPVTIIEQGNLDFDEYVDQSLQLPYYYARRGDRIISFYSIVPGLMNLPVFLAAKAYHVDLTEKRFALSKYTAAILAAGSVTLIYFTLLEVCSSIFSVALITFVYAFATCVWSVCAQSLWQHGPSLLFLTAALALLVRPQSRWMPLCGFFLGMAVFNRPTNVVFAAPIAFYMVLYERRHLLLFFLSAALPALAMMWYSQVYWGSILALGQGHRMEGMHGPHHTDFHYPLLKGLAGLLLSPGRGLFVFSPILLFSVPSMLTALFRGKPDPLYRYLALGCLAHLLLFSKWSIWWGGWSFGYRLLIEMLPVLTIFLALFWEDFVVSRTWLRRAFYLALLGSVYVHFLGAFYYPSDWNAVRDVDHHPGALWDVRDTELRRCNAKFLQDSTKRFAVP